MKDYKFVSGPGDSIQRLLNRWSRVFHLTIIETKICEKTTHDIPWIYVLLVRTQKETT